MELWTTVKRKIARVVMEPKKEEPTMHTVNIQTLPEEVLIEIFSYLSLGELCNTVSKVCTQWERLHWDRQLYNLPVIRGVEDTAEDNFLKCLEIASLYVHEKCLREKIETCLNTQDDLKRRTRELKDMIVFLSHLKEMNLIGNYKMPDSEALHLAPLFRSCAQLEELRVFGRFNSWDSELISVCEQVCGTLRVLQLNYCIWTAESARAITKCLLLEDMSINFNFGLAEGLLEIANISSLRRLRIHSCFKPTEQTWISMFSNGALEGLTYLHLKKVRLSDKAADALGINLKNLTELYICAYLLHGSDNIGLRSIIKGCKNLTTLEIKCDGICKTVTDVMMIPSYLPRLKTLALGIDIIDELHGTFNWQSALKEKMPDLVTRVFDS